MKKPRNNPIKRITNIPDVRVSQPAKPDFKKADVTEAPKIKIKEPMLKRILGSKIAKGILSVLGGAAGFTGSVFAGLDPEFAFLVAVTAVIAIFGGMEKAAKFKGLFDEDLKSKGDSQ